MSDETIALTRRTDLRPANERLVWEIVATATHDSDDTGDVTLTQAINGTIKKVILTVPNFTNSITGQVVLKDNNSRTIFDSGEQAKNATYVFNIDEPVIGTLSIVVGVSGVAGGSGGSIVVELRGV